MRYIIVILLAIVLLIGCNEQNSETRVREVRALQVNTQLHPNRLHKDIHCTIKYQTIDNTTYRIWYSYGFISSGRYFVTVRNSDSIITSIWSKR